MRYCKQLLPCLVLSCILSYATAQEVLTVDTANSKVWVDGTSTLKNWSAQVNAFEGKVTLDESGKLSKVELSFDASTMDGGRGPDMNNKIYKALKTSEYPEIKFVGGPAAGTTPENIAADGKISLAGKEKTITISANGSFDQGIQGSQALKLSDFDIEPPTAMFGQIVCHDDITIGFELTFKQ